MKDRRKRNKDSVLYYIYKLIDTLSLVLKSFGKT